MTISTLKEIRDNVLNTTQQDNAQIGSMVNDFANLTLHEIENPGWCFSPRKEIHHRWSFLKRKTSFSTVASIEDYVIERDIRNIGLVRQTTTPTVLTRYVDYDFYHDVPYPAATGNPLCYRQWEMSGVTTKLAVADTIDVVSSSASDSSDTDLTVTVWGYVNNILQSESYTLNGTTAVTGSTSFDAREIFVSKSKNTVGTITITENSGSTTLTTLGKEERNPLHKVISLYPIPSAAITIYVEGWGHMKEMVRDGDTPPFDQSYHYIVRLGTLAKVYQHLGKDALFAATQAMYAAGVRAMVNADMGTSDFIPVLKRHNPLDGSKNWVKRTTDDIA